MTKAVKQKIEVFKYLIIPFVKYISLYETYLRRAKSYYTILLNIYPSLYQQLTRFDRIKRKISKIKYYHFKIYFFIDSIRCNNYQLFCLYNS